MTSYVNEGLKLTTTYVKSLLVNKLFVQLQPIRIWDNIELPSTAPTARLADTN